MSIWFVLYLLFVVAPIGTFVHEGGHALGARIAKADTVVLSIGVGKEALSYSFKKVHLKVHMLFFMGGYVLSERATSYTTGEKCLISICGPLLNILCATGLFYMQVYIVDHPFVALLCLFNVWLAFINIIPFKIGNKQSDGYTILKVLKERS